MTEPAAPAPRFLPPIDEQNRYFWTGGANDELLMLRCRNCRFWIHPPKSVCPRCAGSSMGPEATSGLGTVFTFTVNRHPFHPAVPVPYVIAIVELEDQPDLRFTTNVVHCDPEDVHIGMPVRVTFERHEDVFVPVFEPRSVAVSSSRFEASA
jgi:uncharacterized OB-fold protein